MNAQVSIHVTGIALLRSLEAILSVPVCTYLYILYIHAVVFIHDMHKQVVHTCAIFMQADKELCLLTGQFEDFVLQFLDRWACA